MREILFRGKRVDNGEWVYGSYSFAPRRKGAFGQIISDLDKERHYIVSKTNYEYWEVCPETVGEYTGLTYKKDRKIFEGDIIRTNCNEKGVIRRGEYDVYSRHVFGGYYCVDKTSALIEWTCSWHCEVIGNIWDNPELLEVEE